MKYEIDLSGKTKELKHFWNGTGFSPASLLLNADMRQQVAYLGSIPFQGIRFVRIHYLLDLVKAKDIESPKPLYDWTILDRCLDVLIENNLLPFFELMGNPEEYFTDFTNDSQIRKWKEFINQLALHYIDRYGEECVLQWYFETWNEPDLFWKQSEEAFLNYYDACSEGLSAAHDSLTFGGPGTCFGVSSLYKKFLAHCDKGMNYFTGKKGVRLDFISIHEKGAMACPEDINPSSKLIIQKEKALRAYINDNHSRFNHLPFINNECDPQVGWWDTHTWRAKAYHAAMAVKIINQHRQTFIDNGVNYTFLSNDNGFVGSWGKRTVMARFGLKEDQKAQNEYKISAEEFEEDRSRRNFALIKKPVLSVMTMLSRLGDKQVSVNPVQDSIEGDLGVIATLGKDNQIALLLYNSSDKIISTCHQTVQMELTGIPFSQGVLTEYRIEEGYTDPFSVWEDNLFPQDPGLDLLEKMRDAAEIRETNCSREINIEEGKWDFTTTIPQPSVRLFLISPKTEKALIKVGPLRGETYEGLDKEHEDTLIKWPCVHSHLLRSYEIFYCSEDDTEYKKINRVNTVCTLWLHTRKRDEKGKYKVRAVDFWNRKGKFSDIFEY